MSGEIAVRAYVTEAARGQALAHLRALVCAVLEQEPAAQGEVSRGTSAEDAQACQRVRARGERQSRLVLQQRQCRVRGRHVRWIAEQQIEQLAGERGIPVAQAELDP